MECILLESLWLRQGSLVGSGGVGIYGLFYSIFFFFARYHHLSPHFPLRQQPRRLALFNLGLLTSVNNPYMSQMIHFFLPMLLPPHTCTTVVLLGKINVVMTTHCLKHYCLLAGRFFAEHLRTKVKRWLSLIVSVEYSSSLHCYSKVLSEFKVIIISWQNPQQDGK